MFRTVTFLCTVFQVVALRGAVQVASLIEDQYADDAPVVKPSKSHNDSSFAELSAQLVDSSESPEADPLKTALPKKESKPLELPKCSNGTLQLESGTYEVTQSLEIPEPCNVSSNGATLLLSAPLIFPKTARFEGKLSVNGLGSLAGPCFSFEEHAFIQSSAEMHFADCHNVAANDGDGAKGGAIHVRGNLTVQGNLSIHNSGARSGGGIFVEGTFKHSGGNMRISGSSAWNDGGAVLRKASPIQEERFVSQGHRRRSMEVGFMLRKASPIQEERFVSQGHRRRSMEESFTNSGGEIRISGSSAQECGGGISVEQSFTNSGGNIIISNSSSAEAGGGGIFVQGNFEHLEGKIQISGSSAGHNGGGIDPFPQIPRVVIRGLLGRKPSCWSTFGEDN